MSEKELCQVHFIVKQFLCTVSLKSFQWQNLFDNFHWDLQENLVQRTVNSELLLKYPVKVNYQKCFLKHIIEQLEKQKTDINDCVFDAYGRLVALQDDSDCCYKHYLAANGNIVSLSENRNFISGGTTGLCTWQAAVALAEWCFSSKTKLTNKTIIELGSGIGLTGLSVALNCNPSKIYLTDCHLSVLSVLCANVKLNVENANSDNKSQIKSFSAASVELASDDIDKALVSLDCVTILNKCLLRETVYNSTIFVLNLPWENIDKNFCSDVRVDLVLAADVVYDATLFVCLINALKCLLKFSLAQEVVFACTERNKKTLQDFIELSENNSLKIEELELPSQKEFVWSEETKIRIFSITAPYL